MRFFACLLLLGFSLPLLAQSNAAYDAIHKGQLDVTLKECREQTALEQYDACLGNLRSLEARYQEGGRSELRESLEIVQGRIRLVEAHKKAAALRSDKPTESARVLFSAYSALPAAQFPFEELLPYWNQYLRDESARNRFSPYRSTRFVIRTPKEEPALQESFVRALQNRLVEFSFQYVEADDTSARPDVLIRASLRYYAPDPSIEPRARVQKLLRLTAESASFKWLQPERQVKLDNFEQEQLVLDAELAKQELVQKLADQTTQLLFYYTLRQLFPPPGGSGIAVTP